jgi:hypothetical protein
MATSSHDADSLPAGKIVAPLGPAAGAVTGSVAWVTWGLLVADADELPSFPKTRR